MNGATLEKVRAAAADLFHLPKETITARSSPERIEAWDSLGHLNLILALESQFCIEFVPEEFGEMNTIGDIAKLVDAKLP